MWILFSFVRCSVGDSLAFSVNKYGIVRTDKRDNWADSEDVYFEYQENVLKV